MRGSNHNWIKRYLSDQKQYIEINPATKISSEQIKCGVPHPLLFLLYIDNLKNASVAFTY